MKDLKNLKCLQPNTAKVLKELIKYNYLSNFVLVGGSGLALHLCHRKSQDLDFFTFRNTFDIQEIRAIIHNFDQREIVNLSKDQVDVLLNGVKVTFFNAKWSFLKPKTIDNFNLATLEQLAIMKTNVLFLRAKFRDYYDMYFLAKNLSLKRIFELSKNVLDGINFKLFAATILYINDIEDENISHLDPACNISLKEIRNYFENELKRMANG